MDNPILWTPWRMPYIRGEDREHYDGCVFCVKGRGEPDHSAEYDTREYILARSTHSFVALNMYPYNNGHLLIIPYAHVRTPEDLPPEALLDLMQMINAGITALRKVYHPQAFNVGANIGTEAGAGIPDHFHLHIVPRWNGDTGFLTVVSGTRVVPDLLADTYTQLRAAWGTP